MKENIFPQVYHQDDTLYSAYESGTSYVNTTIYDLKFTGYTNEFFGHTSGYYYYGMLNNECVIVLLSPSNCDEGTPVIDSINVNAKILEGGNAYHELLTNLSTDLDWTYDGISRQLSPYYLSQPASHPFLTPLAYIIYFLSGLIAIAEFISCLLFIRYPALSPACQCLRVYGSPSEFLKQAEEELATLPQLATEDIFITENFFIVSSSCGNAIVPIKEIVWIYKYSNLHKFLWHHFNISYTLCIVGTKYLYVQCPKNLKSDIDGIMSYLAEANQDIFIGFNEENRLKVQAIQGKTFNLKKMLAFFKSKH